MNQSNFTNTNTAASINNNISSSSSSSNNNSNTRNAASASFPFSFVIPDDTEDSSTTSNNSGTSNGRILTRSLAKLHQQQLDFKNHRTPAVTYQKIMTKEKPYNIINILESSRLTGRMPRLISDVITFFIFFNQFSFNTKLKK